MSLRVASSVPSQLRNGQTSNSGAQADAATYDLLLKYALSLKENVRNTAISDAPPVYYGTDSMKDRAVKMNAALSNELFTVKLKQAVLQRLGSNEKFNSGDINASDLSKMILSVLDEMKMKEVVSMVGVSMHEKISACGLYRSPFDRQTLCRARLAKDETVKCIQEIRVAWEEGINEELQAMAVEMKRPFARPLAAAKHPLLDTLVPVSVRESVRFLFDSEDLLETAAAIRDSNSSRTARERSLGLLKIPLVTPTLFDLSKRYHEFHVYAMQFGIDDVCAKFGVKFSQTRHLAAEEVIKNSLDALSARKQLRSGAPPSLRGKLWRIALGLTAEPSDAERDEYNTLVRRCNDEELLTDDLYIMDVLSVSDDTTYFVFDDNMREVTLCFSRDSSIPRDADFLIHAPLYLFKEGAGDGKTNAEADLTAPPPVACPPNGIQPFLGFAKYIAPLCYMYLDNVSIYTTMRAMYCRLWCAMNVISSTSGTLYHVCQTFERLLIEGNLKLHSHLTSLKIEPLQVFPIYYIFIINVFMFILIDCYALVATWVCWASRS